MASVTLNFTAPQAIRIRDAYMDILGVDTFGEAELKAHMIKDIKSIVIGWEREQAKKALVPDDVVIT